MTGSPHLEAVGAVYGAAIRGIARIRLVSFPAAEEAIRLRKFFPKYEHSAIDTPFDRAGQLVRRAIWRLNGIVSPISELGLGTVANELESLVASVEATTGNRQSQLTFRAASTFRRLNALRENPLGAELEKALAASRTEHPTLVVPSAESARFASEWLKSVGADGEVVHGAEVAAATPTDHMLVVGSPSWYPDALITAPRALLVEFVQYEWLSHKRSVEGLLPVESVGVGRELEVEGKTPAYPTIDPADLPPSPNWSAIARQGGGGSDEADPQVSARPVLLSNDHAILFSSEPGSEVTCAVTSDERVAIERIEVRDLAPGVFILVRTSGSDRDFIKDIADRRFGALSLRGQLEAWKRPLRDRIDERGPERVARELRAKGAQTANVRYWASAETIRPRSHHDFKVLLEYLGLSEEGPQLMSAADQVFGAHIEAGHYVRHLLEQRLADVDLSSTSGVTRIELGEGEGEGGELSMFRVLGLADQEFTVAASSLGQPFPLEGAAWLA